MRHLFGADSFHGFFFSAGTYANDDSPGETGTIVSGMNNNGDFIAYSFGVAGFESIWAMFHPSPSRTERMFSRVKLMITIRAPDPTDALVDQAIVGWMSNL
jgi:hypothetical protein